MGLIFSVSGIRGIIGSELTPQVATEVGSAFGTFLGGGTVVLGGDTRASGPMVRSAVAAGLMATGCDVIDLGVVSTPGVGLMVRRLGATGGMVVTASHNPIEYNGIKMLSDHGWALPAEQAADVKRIWQGGHFDLVGTEGVGSFRHDSGTHDAHIDAVLAVVDVDRIRSRKLHVVLDSINGAGCVGTAMLLDRLGCELVHINATPDGDFAHMPEPIAENLGQLCEAMRDANADIGFAQDPDADRLVVVDQNGRFIGEEYTLALAVRHVLSQTPGPVATNLSTSRLIDDVAAEAGVPVFRTPVGEAHVAAAMVANQCVIGGEGNGGVIDPRVVPVRDSFTAIALICDMIAARGKTIGDLADELPRYTMIKRKFPCAPDKATRVLKAIRDMAADQRVNDSDGVRIDTDAGWVHVRASNTEPIMRVMAEALDPDSAYALVTQAQTVIDAVE